jgi:tape measure domain-containing protein
MADIRASLQLDTRKAEKSVDRLGTAIKALASAAAIKATLDLANVFQNLNNRLLAVTASNEAYNQAQKDVASIAQSTRSSLAATGDLYASLTIASEDLGLKQSQVATITETFSKTLKISGAETGAAAGAMVQFGQALASGVLRGDEFNSINETNSKFMGEFASILGVTRGELRKLAEEGVLTADIMADATQIMADSVNDSFDKTNATISEAFEQIRGAITGLLGKVNEETGAFDGLSAALIAVADAINGISTTGLFKGLENLVYVGGLLLSVFGVNKMLKVLASVQGGFIALGTTTVASGKTLTAFGMIARNVKSALTGLLGVVTLGFVGNNKGGFFGAVGKVVANVGRIFIRFLGPLGALVGGLELLSLASKKLGGPDFMAKPREAIKDFAKEMLGLNEQIDNTIMGPPKELFLDAQFNDLTDNDTLFDDPGKADRDTAALREKLRLRREQEAIAREEARKAKELSRIIARDIEKAKEVLIENTKDLEITKAKLLLEGELLGLTKEEKELKTAVFDLESDRKDAVADIQALQLDKNPAKNLQLQLEKIAEINGLYDEQIEKIKEIITANQEAADDFVTRLKEGLENAGIGDFMATVGDGLVKAVGMFEDSLADAIVQGKADFSDLGDFLKQVLAKAMVQKFITGPIGALIGGMFKADGGSVSSGSPYIVGEKGPELFIPGASGTVIPNGNLQGSGMGGGTVNYNINAVDAPSFQALVARDPEFIFSVTEAGRRRIPGRS